ncbi:TlpA family protein disulfide reductase [Pedobacter deserti]|uniref:TlpA family protein disulfide reductase n=1 Tax=Pedobacter deserti TaxID=2817382 RepID=UPI0021096BC9|nr:TlpA disulfide reductase family protein [Pedobacter sp. SYSU D00382]
MKNLIILASLFVSIGCIGQEKNLLTVGDPAPAIHYSKWLKGQPFKPDQKDMVYVYEFWATWCGPCVAAMPHLSQMARKYKGKAHIVGVNVWEKTQGKPYESAIPAVEKFVTASGSRMDYNVIVDNNAQEMGNNWLRAAGQNGIPSTFVIKNGIIQWIGHPHYLEGPLDSLVNGTFDLPAFKQVYTKAQQASVLQSARLNRILKAIKDATDSADFTMLESAVENGSKEIPFIKGALQAKMFEALLTKKSAREAFAYADTILKEFPDMKTGLALIVLDQNKLDKVSYTKAIQWLKESDVNSIILDKMADGYLKMGDYKSAIITMEEAVLKGREELKDQRYSGRVFEYTVEGYKKKLNEIKSKIN